MGGITKELANIPEALRGLSLAKSANTTRERYSRLYKTLAARVPSLIKVMGEELVDFLPGQKGGIISQENSGTEGSDKGVGNQRASPTSYQMSTVLNRTLTDAVPLNRSHGWL